MDLSTTYLGFRLPHPFLPGASPLCDDLDTVRRLEDAGAPALVLRSLFEEQIVGEQLAAFAHIERYSAASSRLGGGARPLRPRGSRPRRVGGQAVSASPSMMARRV